MKTTSQNQNQHKLSPMKTTSQNQNLWYFLIANPPHVTNGCNNIRFNGEKIEISLGQIWYNRLCRKNYIVAQVGYKKYSMISLENGNRYSSYDGIQSVSTLDESLFDTTPNEFVFVANNIQEWKKL
jgi:hypothetical protein